jgi:hypothetical protein
VRWVRPLGSVFILAGGIVSARSANEAYALETCFKAARIADAICSKLPDDPALRRDCFQKTNSAQLECLEHVLSETPAGPATPKKLPPRLPGRNHLPVPHPRRQNSVRGPAAGTTCQCRITGRFFRTGLATRPNRYIGNAC